MLHRIDNPGLATPETSANVVVEDFGRLAQPIVVTDIDRRQQRWVHWLVIVTPKTIHDSLLLTREVHVHPSFVNLHDAVLQAGCNTQLVRLDGKNQAWLYLAGDVHAVERSQAAQRGGDD